MKKIDITEKCSSESLEINKIWGNFKKRLIEEKKIFNDKLNVKIVDLESK